MCLTSINNRVEFKLTHSEASDATKSGVGSSSPSPYNISFICDKLRDISSEAFLESFVPSILAIQSSVDLTSSRGVFVFGLNKKDISMGLDSG